MTDRTPPRHPDLARHLDTPAVKRGDFTLESGQRSGWFCDAKQTTCRADGMLLVADAALAEIPDAVTRGGSMLEAAEVVREAGAEAVLLLSFVDRGGTVAAMAAEHGLPFVALVTAPELGFDYGT